MKSRTPPRLRRHEAYLARVLEAGGYVRTPHLIEPRRRDGGQYKRGWEVRFVVDSEDELTAVRNALAHVGLTPGAPFKKRARLVQPVYGSAAIERLQQLGVLRPSPTAPAAQRRRSHSVPGSLRLADLIQRSRLPLPG
jgi:hypothetical protein